MKAIVWTLLAAIAPITAYGVDGVVLINQSTVMAAGGFPYFITQSGSYKLSGNLTVPANTNGIVIFTSNVTLDLNGFTISTAPSTFSSGISSAGASPGYSSITIRNGGITGFGFPVFAPCTGTCPTLWTLEDLVMPGVGTQGLDLGVSARVWNVTAPRTAVKVECPSLVVQTVALAIGTISGSGCTFVNNATSM